MPRDLTARLLALSEIDREYFAQGIAIAGIDEAGRGPLAGPVVAGCVVMPESPMLEGVYDSKKLTARQRDKLYDLILQTAIFAQTGLATVWEIGQYNILEATKLAMSRAAEEAPCDIYLIDAVGNLDLPKDQRAIVRGDMCCYHIAAASIIAKVTRDRMLLQLHEEYPDYGFAQHKGYGTAAHIDALRRLGPCPEHRRSFIRNFVEMQA